MIRHLRIKFVCINMAIVTVMLCAIFSLGLSIAEGIVKAHRGRIWAKSRNGVNTFFVQLPVTVETRQRAEAAHLHEPLLFFAAGRSEFQRWFSLGCYIGPVSALSGFLGNIPGQPNKHEGGPL